MNSNGILESHWPRVAAHFFVDACIVFAGIGLGAALRLGEEWMLALGMYWPAMMVAGIAFPCTIYLCGLYSPRTGTRDLWKQSLMLAACFVGTLVLLAAVFYLNFSTRIGRGVMLWAALLIGVGVLIHHMALIRRFRHFRERVAFISGSSSEDLECERVAQLARGGFDVVGVIGYDDHAPGFGVGSLGSVRDLAGIAGRERLDRVLCAGRAYRDPGLLSDSCQLRYSGVTVMPLVAVCEEFYHAVPLELVTPDWLMNASGSPQLFYIKKLKRAFDIAAASIGLLTLSPFLLMGMLMVRVSSAGPVFYRQHRAGRFGRPIIVLKLRTMRVDAEKDGVQWSGKDDARVTWVGKFLRQYRVDEIPQLLAVLLGQMSLVGPRPERPEFVESLAAQIPFYRERLMVQPGLTGWAQVKYPYGADVEDARRKLEYDLYYMKHMSLFMDLFIVLDTIRTILRGGVCGRGVPEHPFRVDRSWMGTPMPMAVEAGARK